VAKAAVLAVLFPLPLAASSNSVPDWVKAAAQQPLPTLPETTKAVVLLDDQTYTVDAKGQAVIHEREVIKILRPQGRDSAYPAVWYDKDSKVLSFHAWSIDPAGHEYAVKDNELHDVSAEEGFELYSDSRARVADPPGRDPGGIIAWEYERRERPYLAEADWFFQGDLPRVNQSFNLVLPAGYTYTTNWAHHPKVEAIDLEHEKYRWEMNNQPAIDLERIPMSPSAESLAGRMTVHYAGPGLAFPEDGTWKGVGQWYTAISRDRLAATPEIAAKAAQLTAGKTDFYDKAEAIASFVQQHIRYVAVEIGIGGDQPHFAADIFRGGYGDCKDKSTLLSAMLSSVGLHSDILLVDTRRGFIDPDDPSQLGDHAIAAIEIPKGYDSPKLHSVVTAANGKRYLIFDPTWEETPFGQIESELQGSYGLITEGADSAIIQIPVLSPELDTIHRSATLQLTPDGSLKGSITEAYFGDVARHGRQVFTAFDAAKQQQFVDSSISHDLMAASVSGLKIQNVASLDKDLTTSFDFTDDHFANSVGPLLMVRPRIFGTYTLPVDNKTHRKVAIDLGQTMQGTDSFDIQLPDGYAVDELPDPVKADVGFASYQSSTVLSGRTIHYTRTFTLRQVELPADKYGDLQHLMSVIAADEDSRVVLKRSTQASATLASPPQGAR
jgi:hypothetical protein